MTALTSLLGTFRDTAKSEREKGNYFEKLVKVFGSAQGFVRKWAIGVWHMPKNTYDKVSVRCWYPTVIFVQKNR